MPEKENSIFPFPSSSTLLSQLAIEYLFSPSSLELFLFYVTLYYHHVLCIVNEF